MRLTAIIVAAGAGQRMGGAQNKALLPLAGRPILDYALKMWQGLATETVVATLLDDWSAAAAIAAPYGKMVHLMAGGEHRCASVARALTVLDGARKPDLIAVHDAARPLTAISDIKRVIEAAEQGGAAILAAPPVDTIRWQEAGFCGATLPRKQLLAAQTPQICRADWLIAAYAAADEAARAAATDDATLVMAAGYPCAYIWAEHPNPKLTYPEDLALAEAIIKSKAQRAKKTDP